MIKPFLFLKEKSIEEIYVDLAVISDVEVMDKLMNPEKEYQSNILRSKKNLTTLEEIITDKEQFAFITGVPGIGKSTLVKKMILEWKEGRLFNGNNETPTMH